MQVVVVVVGVVVVVVVVGVGGWVGGWVCARRGEARHSAGLGQPQIASSLSLLYDTRAAGGA